MADIFEKNRYQIVYPIESQAIHLAKNLKKGARRCYEELKAANITTPLFVVHSIDTNELFHYEVPKYKTEDLNIVPETAVQQILPTMQTNLQSGQLPVQQHVQQQLPVQLPVQQLVQQPGQPIVVDTVMQQSFENRLAALERKVDSISKKVFAPSNVLPTQPQTLAPVTMAIQPMPTQMMPGMMGQQPVPSVNSLDNTVNQIFA